MEDSKNCSICLRALSNEVYRLECRHEFHPYCILTWFRRQHHCPICRMEVEWNEQEIVQETPEQDAPEEFTYSKCLYITFTYINILYVNALTIMGITIGNFLPFPSDIVFMFLSSVLLLYYYYTKGKQILYESRDNPRHSMTNESIV